MSEPTRKVTSTNDPAGGGRPRLIFAERGTRLGEGDGADRDQQEFELLPGVTTIGSSPDADVRLTGLRPQHAEVRRDKADEYLYVHLDSGGRSTVDGVSVGEKRLHTGDRIELGDWVLSFARAESADHGRPYGGRQGGELSYQRTQQTPRDRGPHRPEAARRTATTPASTSRRQRLTQATGRAVCCPCSGSPSAGHDAGPRSLPVARWIRSRS